MPFFQPPKTGKAKRKIKAYYQPTLRSLETLLRDYRGYCDTRAEGESIAATAETPMTMKCRTQKGQQNSPAEQRDVGEMLRRQTQPKMAAEEAPSAPMRPVQPAQAPATQTEGSLSKTLPALTEIGEHNLATKQDLQRWMHKLQDLIAKDIGTIKADVRQNTDRVHAVEESVSTIGNEITHIKETLYTMLAVQVSTQGDHLRRNHIKLRGVPAAITQAEQPHFLRRLLATILPPAAARKITLECSYRLPAGPNSPPTEARDIILCCATTQDRITIMNAVKGKTPLAFENAQLLFFQDLTRATLQWRKTMYNLTSRLRQVGIQYRWGAPRVIKFTHKGSTYRATSETEIPAILTSLGLMDLHKNGATNTSSPMGDPATTNSFTPLSQRSTNTNS
ncbi:Hypothetical predicted protein [Pelobates cultripes]|uniref:Uncharacterized protein n=1 Tax=Pelobates cultripes TaxID=61616 RepID=A0AAD1SSJ1_PELCU|nr:Hypothetical predicted protein [Pelobates cultripes]